MYGFAAGFAYQNFTNLQCNVTFTPSTFSVLVDVARSNISMTLLETSTVTDTELTGFLTNVSFHQVQYISEAVTTIYTSFIGQSFLNNIENIQARKNHTHITATDVSTGVARALESFIDNSLSIYGATQVMIAGDRANVTAKVQLMAVKLGEPVYVYISFGISLAVVILVVSMAMRTRFWRDLPMFDCMEIKSAILGASAGGSALSDVAHSWNDDPTDRGAGAVGVVVANRTDGHTVIVAGQTVASRVERRAAGAERRRGEGYQKLNDPAEVKLRSGQIGFGALVVR